MPVTDSVLEDIQTTPLEVRKILNTLNVGKATGCDGISNRILRECADSLCYPLARLFNLSLQSGEFPSSWKLANVVPIFRKDNRKKSRIIDPFRYFLACQRFLRE